MFNKKDENRTIVGSIILFWWAFWLLNVVHKIISTPTVFWVGQDRLSLIVSYLGSLGLSNPLIAMAILALLTIAELTALLYFTLALFNYWNGKSKIVHQDVFVAMLASLFVFGFLVVGDQLIGDRIVQNAMYMVLGLMSWKLYASVSR